MNKFLQFFISDEYIEIIKYFKRLKNEYRIKKITNKKYKK